MTTPISIIGSARKRFRALVKSQENIKAAVRDALDSFDSGPYADVGNAGETFLSKTPDTQDLDIEMWNMNVNYLAPGGNTYSLGPAEIFREDIKYKLDSALKTEQQSSYEDLNGYIVRCFPSETREGEPRAVAREPDTGLQISAADFRWMGDVSGLVSLGRAKNKSMQLMRDVLKVALNFVGFIAPVKPDAPITFTPIEKNIEGYDIQVDIKGNKIVKVDTTKESSNV